MNDQRTEDLETTAVPFAHELDELVDDPDLDLECDEEDELGPEESFFERVGEELDARLDAWREDIEARLDPTAETASDFVFQHPLRAVAVLAGVFVAGMVAGVLLAL